MQNNGSNMKCANDEIRGDTVTRGRRSSGEGRGVFFA